MLQCLAGDELDLRLLTVDGHRQGFDSVGGRGVAEDIDTADRMDIPVLWLVDPGCGIAVAAQPIEVVRPDGAAGVVAGPVADCSSTNYEDGCNRTKRGLGEESSAEVHWPSTASTESQPAHGEAARTFSFAPGRRTSMSRGTIHCCNPKGGAQKGSTQR